MHVCLIHLQDATAWRAVAAALNVTPHQRAQLAQLRVMYLRVLGRMARQRRDMVATLQVLTASVGTWSSWGHRTVVVRAPRRGRHAGMLAL